MVRNIIFCLKILNLGTAEEWARSKVVSEIGNNKTFITTIRSDKGEWARGEDVRIITVNNTKYLRTDKNNTEKDNLGKLPEF